MSSNVEESNFFLMILKGVTLTIVATLSCILLFALVVKLAMLDYVVIKWVNQFLKIFSVFIGVFFSIKGKMGFVKGALVGFLSSLVTLAIFALMGSESVTFLRFVIDTLFYVVIGAICGVLAVNRKSQ